MLDSISVDSPTVLGKKTRFTHTRLIAFVHSVPTLIIYTVL